MANPNPKTDHLLPPWTKGHTGNPRGGSEKQRMRRSLWAATRDLLDSELPEALQHRLSKGLQDLNLKQVADIIAARLCLAALDPNESKWMDAVQQIRALDPGTGAEIEEREAPVIPTDDERRKAVAEALREAGIGIPLTPLRAGPGTDRRFDGPRVRL